MRLPHTAGTVFAMTLKFLVDGFWFFVERQRQKMWVIEGEAVTQ